MSVTGWPGKALPVRFVIVLATAVTQSVAVEDPDVGEIGESDVHDILRNDRRRMVLEQVAATSDAVTARELSEEIAARETGSDPPPRDARRSVYISLHQNHLPKLDDLDVVDYDDQTKAVRPGPNASTVGVHMADVPGEGRPAVAHYGALAAAGAALVVAAAVDAPLVGEFTPAAWAIVGFAAIATTATYQTHRRRHRHRQSLAHQLEG